MSDYCKCCETNTEHICQHYDPDGITRPHEKPADVLEIFRASDNNCLITLKDVKQYIEELKEATK